MSSVVQIDIGGGLFTLIDADDLDFVRRYRWRRTNGKTCLYVRTAIEGRVHLLHRLIIRARPGEMVDHANRDGLDNRKANLRLCTRFENNSNKRATPNRNGYRGVCRQGTKFFAMLRHEHNSISGPRRLTALEAARDYDDLARTHHRDFAFLNFPEERLNWCGDALRITPPHVMASEGAL